jgi:hypothetical protein
MKTILKTFIIPAIAIALFSCNDDKETEPIVVLEATLVADLAAPNDVIDRATGQVIETRPFQYFSLEQNQIVSESDDWDLAFKGTTVRVNSGKGASAAIVTGIFDQIIEIPASATFVQDTESEFAIPTGGGNGWYNYNSSTNTITPIPGRVVLVKTSAGNYTKIEILSYYKGNPPVASIDPFTTPSAHYTLRYILQPDGTQKF